MESTDATAREEEFAVIACIYPDDWQAVKNGVEYQMRFDLQGTVVKISFTFPSDYPSANAPQWKLVSRNFSLSGEQQQRITAELTQMYNMEKGPVVFKWIDWFKDHLSELIPAASSSKIPSNLEETSPTPPAAEPIKAHRAFHIVHGQPLTDRKSKFIASMVRVCSSEEVDAVFALMKSDRNFCTATHIITAVRVRTADNRLNELRNDDGETGAGDKLLFLLTQLKLENVMIMVSRWFGGIQLGPDRFKHISNQARALLATVNELPPLNPVEETYIKQKSGAEVFNRIRWDTSYDKEHLLVNVEEKSGAITEMTFAALESLQVSNPDAISRIRLLKHQGVVIWDPRANVDKLFKD